MTNKINDNPGKSVTLKINKKTIFYFLISLALSFIVTFLLQHTKKVQCANIFPQEVNWKRGEWSYNYCQTQNYTIVFDTFFGNTVKSDFEYYNNSVEINEAYAKILEDKGEIVNADKSLNEYNYIRTKYRYFLNKQSGCDCTSYSHSAFIYLKATCVDFVVVIIIALVLTLSLYLIKKFNFKIKIVK